MFGRISFLFFSKAFIVSMVARNACTCLNARLGCNLPSKSVTGYLSRPGDIVIGGTFMINLDKVYTSLDFSTKPPELQCRR